MIVVLVSFKILVPEQYPGVTQIGSGESQPSFRHGSHVKSNTPRAVAEGHNDPIGNGVFGVPDSDPGGISGVILQNSLTQKN